MASLTLRQLNLEPTRPNGLMGCKVPTDLMKISVKVATHMGFYYSIYCQTSNITCTLVGNKIVDHSDVVGASPVSAAPTTSSFST